MNIRNQAVWNSYVENNQNGYGGEIIRYAQAWADLMEAELAAQNINLFDGGGTLTSEQWENFAEIAERTRHEANTNGISGFMYGAAVKTLFDTWAGGEALGRWHNKDYGHKGTKKGIANPALLVLK